MPDFVAIKPVGRVSLTATEQGLEIVIPTHLLAKAQSTGRLAAVGRSGVQMFWLLGWGVLGLFSIQGLLDSVRHGLLAGVVSAGVWFCMCAYAEIMVGLRITETLFGKEKIVFSGAAMTINDYLPVRLKWQKPTQDTLVQSLRWRKTTRYELAKISNVRTPPAERRVAHGRLMVESLKMATAEQHSRITFDYGGVPLHCGKYLNDAEAGQLAEYIADIIRFRCHAIERIVFGKPPSPLQGASMTLHNPDVTELTFPFVRLQQIIIYPETYDFYLVERFITYAVNSIGQEYLKEQVEVHLYGDPERLQPNLRNSLTNLCKNVVVSDTGSGHEMMATSSG